MFACLLHLMCVPDTAFTRCTRLDTSLVGGLNGFGVAVVFSAVAHIATLAFQYRLFWPSSSILGNVLCSNKCVALHSQQHEVTLTA